MASTGKYLHSSGAVSKRVNRGSKIDSNLCSRGARFLSLNRRYSLTRVLIAINCTDVSFAELN